MPILGKIRKSFYRLLKFFLPKPINKIEYTVFHENELEELLSNFGLIDAFKNDKLKCACCEQQITKENLHYIYSESGNIKFCCDNPGCLRKIAVHLKSPEVDE